jgi:hypothetical protein
MNIRTERQAHGFRFESAVISTLNLEPSENYTSTWDAFDNGNPISIKCISSTGNVDCGSIVRMFEHFQNPGWEMIVGRHKNKIITSVHRYLFTEEVCSLLKGDLTLEEVSDLDSCIKSFGEGYHEEAREVAKEWKAENRSRMGLLTVQPKIDSRRQRRVQCGINRSALNKLFSKDEFAPLQHLVGVNFAKDQKG